MDDSDRIQIKDLVIFRGKNIYSHRPVMKLIVDIGEYCERPTKDIPGFNDRLLAAFPGLRKNCCGLGYEGGFVERLREGTYLGHVLEHVILEMQAMIGYDVRFGKTRLLEEPSTYYLVYEYLNEVGALECSKAGVFILNAFLNGEELDVREFIDYLREVATEAELGPSTTAIVEEAQKRNIPVTRIGHESLVQLSYGRNSRLIESTLTDVTSCISADISSNKHLTKSILGEHRIPVPFGKVVYSEISAVLYAHQIGMPVVVKPSDGNQGKGVHLNLGSDREIKAAYRDAAKYGSGVIVEEYIRGKDYRILVVGDRVCAVSERVPAHVTGDGAHTVRELVDLVNRDPRRGNQHEKQMTKIRLDETALENLKKAGLTQESVPAAEQVVMLRENGNLSTGGTAIDCTEQIDPENAEVAVRAAKAIGIDIAGIDVVADDISQPILRTGGAVVEVNTAPGIRMHLYPSVGKPRNVAKDIVDFLFPDERFMRFPIVSVTGTNGKTTTVRLIAHTLALTGLNVGMTSTSGTYIGRQCICRGDHSGPISAKTLLSDKTIDAAVLETARGGIIRGGLGYDLADVGVITNISEDHLGLDQIDTIEDLAFVKSLVVEAVKKDGYAVLNAQDAMTKKILERVRVKPILFSAEAAKLADFSGLACMCVFAQDGWIKIRDQGQVTSLMPVSEIPITFNGMLRCNVENCLAAVAALYALNVPKGTIIQGLQSFYDNEGRFNLYERGGVRVMLDYGHNPSGYGQALAFCRSLDCGRLVGVVGMPGDRPDSAMAAVGRLCAQTFDRLYIKEDKDLRGREPGEVAGIFYHAVVGAGFARDRVTVIGDEAEALEAALREAEPDDLIVVFYEKLEPLRQLLAGVGAVKIDLRPAGVKK